MHSLIAAAAAAVSHHPALTLLVAFAGAVIEAVAVLGCLLPGTPVLMAVAGVASVAGMPVLPILVVAVLGAVIGDGVSFWLGHRFGAHIRTMWPFRARPELIAGGEAFFRRFGVPSVALARFVPVVRSTVPLVAGMTGMSVRPFFVANVLSALVWAPVHVVPAHWAGVALSQAENGGWWLAALTAAGVALFGAAILVMHRLGREAPTVGRRQSLPRP